MDVVNPNDDTRSLLEHLIETCEDGARGFDTAAEAVDDTNVAATFRKLGAERAQCAMELRSLAANYGGPVEEAGMVKAALHRGWIKLKDALTTGSHAVIAAAEEGEDYALEQYEEALREELPSDVAEVVRRQRDIVKAAHDQVRAMEVATS